MAVMARRGVDFRQLLLADQLKAVGRGHSWPLDVGEPL
jgi:hypothetical protein